MAKKFKNTKFIFTEKELNFLNGILLSDGYINKRDFSFSVTSSSKQFLEYIMTKLPPNIWRNNNMIREEAKFDKRINKTLMSYRLISKSNEIFYDLRQKWYPNGIKIIPSDIIIDKNCLLGWYLGDGSLNQHHLLKRTDGIKLCTNSFSPIDIETFLLPQLNHYNPRITYTEKKQPIITIPRNKCDLFLNDIGNAPFDDYKHKWAIYPYKNKTIEENGITYLPEEVKNKIIEMYKNGKSITTIAQELKLTQGHVRYYCIKEKIYIPRNKFNTYEVSLDNGVTYEIVENLNEFCKKNTLCYTNMINLCSGKIPKYKNIKIKKIKNKGYEIF